MKCEANRDTRAIRNGLISTVFHHSISPRAVDRGTRPLPCGRHALVLNEVAAEILKPKLEWCDACGLYAVPISAGEAFGRLVDRFGRDPLRPGIDTGTDEDNAAVSADLRELGLV